MLTESDFFPVQILTNSEKGKKRKFSLKINTSKSGYCVSQVAAVFQKLGQDLTKHFNRCSSAGEVLHFG